MAKHDRTDNSSKEQQAQTQPYVSASGRAYSSGVTQMHGQQSYRGQQAWHGQPGAYRAGAPQAVQPASSGAQVVPYGYGQTGYVSQQQIPYAGAGAGVAGAAGMPGGGVAGAAAAAPGTPGAANIPTYVPPRTSMPPEEPKRKKRGVAFWIAFIIALLAIAAAVVLAFILLNPAKANRSGDLGQLEGKTAAEVQAELDRVVEEGMFNISIASVVEFADGTSEGELRIENVPNNNYLMRVEITRDDTGETIYQTDVIEPNHHIQSDVLDADLDPGSYECTATFFALDPETEDEIGQVAAAMKINVLG